MLENILLVLFVLKTSFYVVINWYWGAYKKTLST